MKDNVFTLTISTCPHGYIYCTCKPEFKTLKRKYLERALNTRGVKDKKSKKNKGGKNETI